MNRRTVHVVAAIVVTCTVAVVVIPEIWTVRTISGTVQDDGRPLADVSVRIPEADQAVLTDSLGQFRFSGLTPSFQYRLTAWKDGYFVSGETAWPWDDGIDVALTSYEKPDHAGYAWLSPVVEDRTGFDERLIRAGLSLSDLISTRHVFLLVAERINLGCADCHRQIVEEWESGAHASGVRNTRFMTIYNGSDSQGRRSPLTRHGFSTDYGAFPLRPNDTEAYYGPGYKLDFPGSDGNCGTCHFPSASLEEPYGVNPNQLDGVDALGTHCDFCHKIKDVKLDPSTGRPFPNMPGVLSIELRRPREDQQIFFGPYDDVDLGPDTYLPLMQESEICAPCHDASFWGVPIYESFAEWLASPYPELGLTCQSCHMAPDGVTTNFAPGRGGEERDPDTIPTHHFPGAADTVLIRNAVTMDVVAERLAGELVVTATVTNDRTGHHVPTDSPLRHLLLLVRPTDEAGRPLVQQTGPTVPEWGGIGDPEEGYYAGQPGKVFAKVLEELWTGISPTAAYWNPTRLVSDNRIAAFASDSSRYTFSSPDGGDVRIEVTLLYRRAFIELMDQKGWDTPDILVARQILHLTPREVPS
jgi:hypothetical protein